MGVQAHYERPPGSDQEFDRRRRGVRTGNERQVQLRRDGGAYAVQAELAARGPATLELAAAQGAVAVRRRHEGSGVERADEKVRVGGEIALLDAHVVAELEPGEGARRVREVGLVARARDDELAQIERDAARRVREVVEIDVEIAVGMRELAARARVASGEFERNVAALEPVVQAAEQ